MVLKRRTLAIQDVYVPVQRRRTLDPNNVEALAESMLVKGQEAPILVRPDGTRFVLLEGLHRLEACKALGRGEPCRRSPAPGKARCRLHGGAPGSGAPAGERNGAWKGGRYSRIATPEQRRQDWQEYWTAKRVQNTALSAIPDISEALQTLWPLS